MRNHWLLTIGFFGLAACSPTALPPSSNQLLTLTAAPTVVITPHPLKVDLEAKLDWSCPPDVAGQTLRIAGWPDYVAHDTLSNFEALCGVTVDYQTTTSSDELFRWLSEGKMFDVAMPTSSYVLRLTQLNMLYPVRQTQIAHTENLNPSFMNFLFDPENRYTTPYTWGTTGITYNAKRIGKAVETWEQFFAYEGPVAWVDEYRMVMNVALSMQGFKPNSTNPNEINAAKDFLLAHIGNVVMIDSYKALRDGLQNGLIDMTIDYSGNALIVSSDCGCDTYRYALPTGGSSIWIDSMVIPVNAPNKHLGEVFISYILLPQVGADIANFSFYATPNLKAINNGLISPNILSNPIIYPPEEKIDDLFFTLSVPEDIQVLYSQAWSEVVAALEAKHGR